QLIGRLDHEPHLNAAKIRIASILALAWPDIRSRVDAIVFTKEIGSCSGVTTTCNNGLGKQSVQLARANRHLFSSRSPNPETGDGFATEQIMACFQGVGDIFSKLCGVRFRRARPVLAGACKDS